MASISPGCKTPPGEEFYAKARVDSNYHGTNKGAAASNLQPRFSCAGKVLSFWRFIMKKFVSLLLAALLVLSLTACGSKNNHSGDKPATPTSALNILETVWNTYGEDEKFSVVGGDFSEANLKEDAPGVFDLKDRALADSELGLPETAAVDEAASLVHMMNANTFTAAAYHATGDTTELAQQLRDNIMQRQWMCGFPDKLVVAVVDEYVVAVFGAEDLIDTFMTHLNGIYGVHAAYDEAIQ